MNDISDLQRRLGQALDRIAEGLDGVEARRAPELTLDTAEDTGPTPEMAALQAELEAEREVTAQLEERVRALRESQDGRVAELEAALADLQAKLAPLQAERQRLKGVNAALRKSNQALRTANQAGLPDAAAINQSMADELDAIRAVQESDSAELNGILADLAPILKEAEAQNA